MTAHKVVRKSSTGCNAVRYGQAKFNMPLRRGILTALAALLAVSTRAHNDVLDTVTVYAQKREAELQDAPLTLAVLAGEELRAAGIDSIIDVAERLPTLDLQSTASATTTSLRIRRVGALGNIPTFEPAVGLFVDGAFRSRSMLGVSDLPDLHRVEVLSGPQLALYGKAASAGVIALYTRAPTEELHASAEFSRGWIDVESAPSLTSAKASLSGPLTPTLGATLAGAWSDHGDTWSNALADRPDGNNESRFALRGQLAWSDDELIDLRLIVGYAHAQERQSESDVFISPGALSHRVARALHQLEYEQVCADNAPYNRRACSIAPAALHLEALEATLLSAYEFSNGWTLTSVTAWDRYEALRTDDDVVQLSTPVLFFRDSEEGASLQEELRLSSGEGPASWLAGAFFYRHDHERGLDGKRPMFGPNGEAAFDPIWQTLLGVPLALPGEQGLHDSYLETRYASVFGQIAWRLTERLSVTTGARWQYEEKKGGIRNSVTTPGASFISNTLTPAVAANGEAINGVLERTADDTAWSFTTQYEISNALMSYLTVARGAKSGGFNTAFGSAPLAAREFDDEHISHYELGARGAFDRMRFSAAAFYTRYDDYQDAAFISAQFSVGNAERAELHGVELEGAALLGERTRVDFALSAVDLTYETNTTGVCYPGRTPDGTAPRSCDLSGEHPIAAPVWAAHVGAQYDYATPWADLRVRVDWSWTDEHHTSFSADHRLVKQPASDVAIRLSARFDRYEIALWADNLLNEDVAQIDAVLNLFNDASYQSYMGRPRQYGATVRVRFP